MEGDGTEANTGESETDSTPTETVTQTVEQTVTSVGTTQGIGTEGGFPVSTGTPGMGSGDVGSIDPSTFTTYTNATYSYSIQYPGGWQVNDRDPAVVNIEPASGIPSMRIDVNEDQGQMSLDDMSNFLDSYLKERFAAYEAQNKRKITLQTGQKCLIVEAKIRMESQGKSVTLYDKYSMTNAAGRMYMVQTFSTESGYPTVKDGLDRILESLKISA